MTLRHCLTPALLLSLSTLSACPDDGGDTTEGASTVSQPTSTDPSGSATSTDSSGPATTTTPPGTTSAAESTTGGGPMIPCEDATTEDQCATAGSGDSECGWFVTRSFAVTEECMEVSQGGLCLTTARGDDTCGLTLDPTCMDTDVVVYARPSTQGDGAIETLAVGSSDVCDGPALTDGWEICAPDLMMAGCSCGCG